MLYIIYKKKMFNFALNKQNTMYTKIKNMVKFR